MINFSDNRQILGEIDGIDILLQQLAVSFLNFFLLKYCHVKERKEGLPQLTIYKTKISVSGTFGLIKPM